MQITEIPDPTRAGFQESKHRPWLVDTKFIIVDHSPGWRDLCHRMPDSRLVYLTSRPRR